MPFKRRCMTCGSKQWHKEPSSGLIACSEGHVLQSYWNESKEVDVAGPHMMQRRSLKNTRQKREARSKANPQLYHGARGRYLYFQCLQTLLRLQVSTLTKLWSLPTQFEVVCRDVWALNLCLFPNPIHGDTDETQVTGEDKESDTDIRDTNDQSDSLDQDEEMDQLLRESSESSSDSDGEENPKVQVNFNAERKTKGTRLEEGPASTIAVLVVTCWLLRIPVMYQDFARIIEAYELPYLDSVRLLPTDITLHLTKHAIQSLSPHHAPKTLTLHAISSRLAKKLYSKYGIMTPEMNAAPLLWRAIRWYKGTPTLYALTKRLLQVLPVSLVLHPSVIPNTLDTNYEKHGREIVPIEVTFIAAIIIVLKMTYGLDGTARVPRVPNDPACSLPLWEDYMENLRSEEKGDMTKFDSRKALSIDDLDDADVD
ncbi:hypothetical protein F5887DRAFT_1069097 [Amanita rubescens]|nr:hypothetical protein F5887DRAFT_1069097 [Amanita rubescens]